MRRFYDIVSSRSTTASECHAYGGAVLPHRNYKSHTTVAQGVSLGTDTAEQREVVCVAFGEEDRGWIFTAVKLGLCCWPIR